MVAVIMTDNRKNEIRDLNHIAEMVWSLTYGETKAYTNILAITSTFPEPELLPEARDRKKRS